jgi:hypothetical protein
MQPTFASNWTEGLFRLISPSAQKHQLTAIPSLPVAEENGGLMCTAGCGNSEHNSQGETRVTHVTQFLVSRYKERYRKESKNRVTPVTSVTAPVLKRFTTDHCPGSLRVLPYSTCALQLDGQEPPWSKQLIGVSNMGYTEDWQ